MIISAYILIKYVCLFHYYIKAVATLLPGILHCVAEQLVNVQDVHPPPPPPRVLEKISLLSSIAFTSFHVPTKSCMAALLVATS